MRAGAPSSVVCMNGPAGRGGAVCEVGARQQRKLGDRGE